MIFFRLSRISILAMLVIGCAEQQIVEHYREPLTSPGAQFVAMPPAAQNSVRAEAGAAEISNIVKLDRDGQAVYVIHFGNADFFPPLYVANDGSVLTSNLAVAIPASQESINAATGVTVSGIKLDDLPPNVVKTIHEKAPTAEIASVTKLTAGKIVFYEVTFKDSALNPKLLISDDGTLVKRSY